VSTMSAPNKSKAVMMGSSQNFLRCFKKPQRSSQKSIQTSLLGNLFHPGTQKLLLELRGLAVFAFPLHISGLRLCRRYLTPQYYSKGTTNSRGHHASSSHSHGSRMRRRLPKRREKPLPGFQTQNPCLAQSKVCFSQMNRRSPGYPLRAG